MKLSNLKPLHVLWIVELFDYLKHQNESIMNHEWIRQSSYNRDCKVSKRSYFTNQKPIH